MKWAVPLLAPALFLVSACSKKEAVEPEVAAPVQVAKAATETMHLVVTADAVIYPIDQANVMSKVSAPVARFYVNRGDHVNAGQLIATLENRDLVAAVNTAQAQLEQAQANFATITGSTIPEAETKATADVQAAQEQLAAATKLLESRRKLFQEGALARKLVDEAQVAFAQAKAAAETAQEHLYAMQKTGSREQVATARAQVDAAKAQLQAAQAQVAFTEVRSPINGIVADRPLYPGDMASTGQPLATVVDISRVVARANVPQSQASALHVGDAAVIEEVPGGLEAPGTVTVVSPTTEPNSTTMQVWVRANNPKGRLKPGVSVRVRIQARTIPRATVVPETALLSGPEGGATVVVVSPGDVARVRPVTVGPREDGKVQILSGVTPGATVVTTGGMGLEDGAKVRIVQPGGAGGGGSAAREAGK
jgi:HlyD family secretion protein